MKLIMVQVPSLHHAVNFPDYPLKFWPHLTLIILQVIPVGSFHTACLELRPVLCGFVEPVDDALRRTSILPLIRRVPVNFELIQPGQYLYLSGNSFSMTMVPSVLFVIIYPAGTGMFQ